MRKLLLIILAVSMLIFVVTTGCDDEDYSYLQKPTYDPDNNTGDNDGGSCGVPSNPSTSESSMAAINYDNINPSTSFALDNSSTCNLVQINVSGLFNPNTGDPIVPVFGENFFLFEDGNPRGLKITKVDVSNVLQADVVFTVDNSGSMSGEADSIAAGIIKFAQLLEASGLDVRFGCIGYDGSANGGINFTTAEGLEAFLNTRNGHPIYGTSRTYGFGGSDSAALYNAAIGYASGVWGENGVVGIRFADENFSWRAGASHQYINFTDEPTQPGGLEEWSSNYLCDLMAGKANIHTVFSEDTTYYSWTDLSAERPWEISECTGGTMAFVQNDASDLDLSTLPVVGSLTNSYLIEFITSNPDCGTPHTITIYIYDEGADGYIEIGNVYYCGS
ncbi:MAG: vWA domain-containing protein [bacterium]